MEFIISFIVVVMGNFVGGMVQWHAVRRLTKEISRETDASIPHWLSPDFLSLHFKQVIDITSVASSLFTLGAMLTVSKVGQTLSQTEGWMILSCIFISFMIGSLVSIDPNLYVDRLFMFKGRIGVLSLTVGVGYLVCIFFSGHFVVPYLSA